MAENIIWGESGKTDISAYHLARRTWASGEIFPVHYQVGGFFFHISAKTLKQNVGTFLVPVWSSVLLDGGSYAGTIIGLS